MAANYKVLADFEVATAEDAQSYFMDQAIIKVDSSADLPSLPTTVKTAYVLNTGIFMTRNVANDWVPSGGSAAVDETAPANPQVGQLWVKPSEVLPVPARAVDTGNLTISATTWGSIPAPTASVTLPKAAMCQVSTNLWARSYATGSDLRLRIAWSGALTGNTYDSLSWGGVLYLYGYDWYGSLSMSHTIAVPAGTTTFSLQGYKAGSGTNPTLSYRSLSVTPVAWADSYAAGVS